MYLQALNQVQITHKKASHAGIHAEESLLLESASREADFINTITDLEAELKHARQELDRLQAENEKLGTNNVDMTQQVNGHWKINKARWLKYGWKQKNGSLLLFECICVNCYCSLAASGNWPLARLFLCFPRRIWGMASRCQESLFPWNGLSILRYPKKIHNKSLHSYSCVVNLEPSCELTWVNFS